MRCNGACRHGSGRTVAHTLSAAPCPALWTAPPAVVIGSAVPAQQRPKHAAEHRLARDCLERLQPPHSLCALHCIAFRWLRVPFRSAGRRFHARHRCIKGIHPCWRMLCGAIAGCWSRRAGSRSARCRRSTHGLCRISRRRRPRHRRAGRIGTTARTPIARPSTVEYRWPYRPPACACHRSRAAHGTVETPRSHSAVAVSAGCVATVAHRLRSPAA